MARHHPIYKIGCGTCRLDEQALGYNDHKDDLGNKMSDSDGFRVYAQGDPGNGMGGFDIADDRDQAFAFDYDHSGKLDHLVFYRPGTGTMWILKKHCRSVRSRLCEGFAWGWNRWV
jgi:hypothetical protein